MNSTDFYQLMEKPALLTEETLSKLKLVVDTFPYFHAARMLYLKNLALLNDVRFAQELKNMAVCIPDRRKMFLLIDGERYGMTISEIPNVKSEDNSFSLIDAFLDSQKEKELLQSETTLLFESSSVDYIHWSLTREQTYDTTQESDVKLQHQELIDSFIQSEENRPPGIGLSLDESSDISSPMDNDETHLKSLDDSFFTETLARIYVKQKRYDKALQIIKNLSLKYPEKNVYFADQIRFLEKLIINTKK